MEEKYNPICNYCDKPFTRTKNLYAHIRNVHKTIPVYQKKPKLICSLCKGLQINYTDLRAHLVNEHNEEIEIQIMEFKNQRDFINWKENMERENMCKYVKSTGKKRARKDYYVCHRSLQSCGGSRILSRDAKNRFRRQRKQGVGKVDVTCPSTMEVTEASGLIVATLYLPHLGHLCSMDHITLTKAERAAIAEKIAGGLTFDEILDDLQKDVDGNFERINLLNRQDLSNIKREFVLDVNTQLHANDAESVHMWTEMMASLEDSPVCFYKKLGMEDNTQTFNKEDFVLIIMTKFQKSVLKAFENGTICLDLPHSINGSNFLLTSISALDQHENTPVAFLVSNRVDITMLTHFFNAVKNKIGVLSVNILMSEDDPEIFNAWSNVMKPPLVWHLNHNHDKQLKAIRNIKRIDGCINSLMHLVRYRMFQNLNKGIEGTESYRADRISANHENIGDYRPEHIIEDGSKMFRIKSSTGNLFHLVEQLSLSFTDNKCCEMICTKCNICIHEFCCSCDDYVLHFDMCKHIHAVVTYKIHCKESKDAMDWDVYEDDSVSNIEHVNKVQTSSVNGDTYINELKTHNSDLITRIETKLDTVCSVFSVKNEIPADDAVRIEHYLDKIIETLFSDEQTPKEAPVDASLVADDTQDEKYIIINETSVLENAISTEIHPCEGVRSEHNYS